MLINNEKFEEAVRQIKYENSLNEAKLSDEAKEVVVAILNNFYGFNLK